MSRQVSEKTKRLQHRGEGTGADYIPYIFTRELNSVGTTSNPVDWKNGRSMQLLSQAELWWYYELRWDDAVEDIREQFPLDLDLTLEIADKYSIKHPKNRQTRMTTDFLVTRTGGHLYAYSVKTSRADVEGNPRTVEKLFLEKMYWLQKDIPWKLLFKDDLSYQRITNIRTVTEYYDKSKVHDNISRVKHLIATKQLTVDMDAEIDYQMLIRQLET